MSRDAAPAMNTAIGMAAHPAATLKMSGAVQLTTRSGNAVWRTGRPHRRDISWLRPTEPTHLTTSTPPPAATFRTRSARAEERTPRRRRHATSSTLPTPRPHLRIQGQPTDPLTLNNQHCTVSPPRQGPATAVKALWAAARMVKPSIGDSLTEQAPARPAVRPPRVPIPAALTEKGSTRMTIAPPMPPTL